MNYQFRSYTSEQSKHIHSGPARDNQTPFIERRFGQSVPCRLAESESESAHLAEVGVVEEHAGIEEVHLADVVVLATALQKHSDVFRAQKL